VLKNKTLKNILFWIICGIFFSLLGHFIIELIYYDYDFTFVIEEIVNVRPTLFLLGSAILFLIYTLFSSIFNSSVIGGGLLLLVSWVTGIATHLKSLSRAEPLYPSDLHWIRELPFLFEMIGMRNTIIITASIIITIFSLILLYIYYIKPRKNYISRRKNMFYRIVGALLSLGLLFYISRFNYTGNKVSEVYQEHARWIHWNQQQNYDRNGFIAGFLYNLDSPPMEPLDDYSRGSIERIYNKYKEKTTEINEERSNEDTDTNVIFVMNESFSDPSKLNGIKSNIDPLTNYRGIAENSLSGEVLVPGFGGGTATNEFQVLTGISLEPLYAHITSPFIQMENRMDDFPSIVAKMNGYGHESTAIHAYVPNFYKRRDVYSDLQFDEFIHIDNMKYTETPSDSHPYISDFSAYQELLDVLNDNTEEPDFIHLVTMQNHGGYEGRYENVDYEVTGTGNQEEANQYFRDLENSDYSLNYLIEQLDEYPEPVLLMFWGDHLPGLYQGEALENNPDQAMYETPLFFYSNEVELEGDLGLRSLIYLNNYVLEILDLKISPFNALLYSLEDRLPVLDRRVYSEDQNSNDYNSREELSEEALEVLEDYSLLMYDITTGNQYASDMGFFEKID